MTQRLKHLVASITPEMVKRHSKKVEPETNRIKRPELAGLDKREYHRRYQAKLRALPGHKERHTAYCAQWRAELKAKAEALP